MHLESSGQGSAGFTTRGNVPALRVLTSGINPMDRAELYRVFELGGALHPLSSITHNDTLAKVFSIIAPARAALQQLLGAAPHARVDLCVPAANELKSALDSINDEYFIDKDTG